MGCDENYLKKVAQETSVPVANCAVWANDSAQNAQHAMKEMGGKLGGYFKMRSSGGGTSSRAFHNTSGLEACDNYIQPDAQPDVSVDVFQPIDKQAIFNNAVDFNVADVQIPPVSQTVKPCTNVFGVGNKVESQVWAKYESSRTTSSTD
jgi:hypothetical protein